MKALLPWLAGLLLLSGMAVAQNGTINNMSVDPRQNQELTNSTGTETGQPSAAVVGSQNEPNGLMPVTNDMESSGSNGNMSQSDAGNKTAAPAGTAKTLENRMPSSTGHIAKIEKQPDAK